LDGERWNKGDGGAHISYEQFLKYFDAIP